MMLYRDRKLEQELCDIANRKGDIAKIAPGVCAGNYVLDVLPS